MTTTFTPAGSVGGAATHVISSVVNITCPGLTSHIVHSPFVTPNGTILRDHLTSALAWRAPRRDAAAGSSLTADIRANTIRVGRR